MNFTLMLYDEKYGICFPVSSRIVRMKEQHMDFLLVI